MAVSLYGPEKATCVKWLAKWISRSLVQRGPRNGNDFEANGAERWAKGQLRSAPDPWGPRPFMKRKAMTDLDIFSGKWACLFRETSQLVGFLLVSP